MFAYLILLAVLIVTVLFYESKMAGFRKTCDEFVDLVEEQTAIIDKMAVEQERLLALVRSK